MDRVAVRLMTGTWNRRNGGSDLTVPSMGVSVIIRPISFEEWDFLIKRGDEVLERYRIKRMTLNDAEGVVYNHLTKWLNKWIPTLNGHKHWTKDG